MAYLHPRGARIRQCDILSGVRTFSIDRIEENEGGEQPVGSLHRRALSVVVTQDCDLEQDYRSRTSPEPSTDKQLFGVLMCGVFEAAPLKKGEHRLGAQKFGKKEWKSVERNLSPRYQYLGKVGPLDLELVADFKDFYMVPIAFLYKEMESARVRRAVEIDTPWREHLLQRFAWYLMRVGLPVDFHRLPSPIPPRDVHLAGLVKYFETENLTLEQAAEMAELSQDQFLRETQRFSKAIPEPEAKEAETTAAIGATTELETEVPSDELSEHDQKRE